MEKTDITVFDHTAEAMLVVWGAAAVSVSDWRPGSTLLLLSRISFSHDIRPTLTLNQRSIVDVNPLMVQAEWLKTHIEHIQKQNHVNQPFPEKGTEYSVLPCAWTDFTWKSFFH